MLTGILVFVAIGSVSGISLGFGSKAGDDVYNTVKNKIKNR